MFYLDQIFNELDVEFRVQVYNVKQLSKKPTDSELLKLYGLYKQSLFGNNKNEKPNFFNYKELQKWNAWNEQAGKGRSNAKKEYIDFVKSLILKYNTLQ
jgi:diazepam-binding inhibitor (GABA receptor modulating acyl-CoA-binding protein)